jgi:hypothetical protein
MFEFTMHLNRDMNRFLGFLAWELLTHFNKKTPVEITDKGLKLHQMGLVAGERFCHYFTSPIQVPLTPKEWKLFNKTKSFLRIPA